MGFQGKSISTASYDAGNRLTDWNRAGSDQNHSQTWDSDDAGNWNSTTKDGDTESRDHSVSNQITQLDGKAVSHDLKGNLTDYEYDRTDYRVKYDLDNRIVEVKADSETIRYRYTAFGEPEIYSATGAKRNTSAIGNTVMWNTRRYDADNGLYYYKYRHYAANIGRWLGRDPIEEDGGVNLYAFVENGPINWWDILGLADIKVTIKRTYLKNETKGELSVTATDPQIAKCCGSVNGQTLELPKGSYELIEYKNYFHGVKGYPIPEGSHEGKYTYSTATSPSKMDPWRNFPNRANIVGEIKI